MFILAIACINFMNMSTAQSAGRAKEVGVRKTLGSLRSQMIGQFLAESMLYSLVAVVLAVILCSLLLPAFNVLSGKELSITNLLDGKFTLVVGLMLLVVGFLAGSYPAFYLTSFRPVEVLKGKVKAGLKSKGIRSILVVFQFAISIFLFIVTSDADVADGPAFRSDPRSRPDQSTGYWLKNVFSTRAMSSGATTCPCPSSVCRSVWGMAAVIAFAARSKKSVGRPANWGSVVGPSVVTRTD